MIYLFDKSKNLIGTIKQRHTINAIFEREVNGLYTLSVDLPVRFSDREGSFDYYAKIDKASYIGHYDLEDKFQMHRLINVDVENGEIHIDAIHIFFDEAKAYGVVAEQKYLKREISYIAPNVFGQIGWTLKDYDPSPTGNVSLYDVSLLEARTLLLETYGFEMDVWLDFDGIKVTSKNYSLKKRIGKTTTKRYTYGSNVLSIKSEEDFGEIYTAVIGLGADQDAIDARIAAAKYEADREAVRKERDRLTAEYKKVRSSYDAARKAVIAKYEADVAAWRTERARLLALRKQKKKVTIPKKPVYPKAAPRPKAPKLPAYPKKPKESVVKTVTEQTREDMKRRVNYSKVVWSKPSKPLNKAAGSRVLVDPVTTEAFGYRDAQGVATPKVKVVIFEDIEDPNELIQKSYEWLQENSRPKALFTAEVVDGDTRVELGDTVTVIYRDIDKVVPIRVAKTTDDLLVKKRKIEFGDLEHVKENDKMKEFVAELKSVKRNFNDALYKRKLEFDTMFADQEESLKTDFEIALEQAQIDVDAFAEEMNITIDTAQEDFMESVEVSLVRAQEDAEERAVAMEQALREEISAQNTALSSDIANSYTQAVMDAEAKVKAMRITGDMAVADDIKTLSLQAVNADIANLRAIILTADSVTATALKVDTALMDKLFVNDLLTNKLVSQTVYSDSVKALSVSAVRADIAWLKSNVITAGSITTDALAADAVTSAKLKVDQAFVDKLMASTIYTDAIKAKSLEAVIGDIANLRSKIITTDVIKASNIASDLAVVDKIFASDALISRLTSKTAFIRDIKAIDLSADRITGGVLRSSNENVNWDLDSGVIYFKSPRNAMRYTSNGWTSGLHFSQDNVGQASAVVGVSKTSPDLDSNSTSFVGIKAIADDSSLQVWGGSMALVTKARATALPETVWQFDMDQSPDSPSGVRAIVGYKYPQLGREGYKFDRVWTKNMNRMRIGTESIESENGANGIYFDSGGAMLIKRKGKYYDIDVVLRASGFNV